MEEGEKYNTLAILSFVFSFLFFPAGFILGIIALSHIKKSNEKGKGLAIAAIVISSVALAFFVLFLLVALFWIGVRNVVVDGDYSGQYQSLTSKCLYVEILPTEVSETMPGVFDVTLSRQPWGEDYIIGGVKIIFTNTYNNVNYIYDAPGDIFEETVRVSIPEEELENPNKVSVVVYFLDDYGDEMICSNANSFSF